VSGVNGDVLYSSTYVRELLQTCQQYTGCNNQSRRRVFMLDLCYAAAAAAVAPGSSCNQKTSTINHYCAAVAI